MTVTVTTTTQTTNTTTTTVTTTSTATTTTKIGFLDNGHYTTIKHWVMDSLPEFNTSTNIKLTRCYSFREGKNGTSSCRLPYAYDKDSRPVGPFGNVVGHDKARQKCLGDHEDFKENCHGAGQ